MAHGVVILMEGEEIPRSMTSHDKVIKVPPKWFLVNLFAPSKQPDLEAEYKGRTKDLITEAARMAAQRLPQEIVKMISNDSKLSTRSRLHFGIDYVAGHAAASKRKDVILCAYYTPAAYYNLS